MLETMDSLKQLCTILVGKWMIGRSWLIRQSVPLARCVIPQQLWIRIDWQEPWIFHSIGSTNQNEWWVCITSSDSIHWEESCPKSFAIFIFIDEFIYPKSRRQSPHSIFSACRNIRILLRPNFWITVIFRMSLEFLHALGSLFVVAFLSVNARFLSWVIHSR